MNRQIDELNSALYPFGYGLTYSTITYSPTKASATTASAKNLNAGTAKLTVSAEVRNTGSRAADEVVQLYIRQTGTSVVRPVRELKGFRRITLPPGQSQKLEFTLAADELRRTGGLDRAVIAIATTTGTGWVNEAEASALEYMYNGALEDYRDAI